MHNFLSRLNTRFAFTLSVLALLTMGVFVSTYFERYQQTVTINTSDASLNQVILWDKIIVRGQNAHVDVRDMATKYEFWDDGEHLRSNNITLTLGYNIISNAGRLLHKRANGSTSFVFPEQYTTSRSAHCQ